jgi:hypothetical protein
VQLEIVSQQDFITLDFRYKIQNADQTTSMRFDFDYNIRVTRSITWGLKPCPYASLLFWKLEISQLKKKKGGGGGGGVEFHLSP